MLFPIFYNQTHLVMHLNLSSYCLLKLHLVVHICIYGNNYGIRTASNYRTHLCLTNLKKFTILYQRPKFKTHKRCEQCYISTINIWKSYMWTAVEETNRGDPRNYEHYKISSWNTAGKKEIRPVRDFGTNMMTSSQLAWKLSW